MSILTLTPEVIHEVLLNLDPVDVSCVAQTCKSLSVFADSESNPVLWRSLFHQLFDPVNGADRPGYSFSSAAVKDGSECYASLLKERCRARGVIRSPHTDKKIKLREPVIRALHGVYMTADNRLPETSKNAAFLTSLLSDRASISEWLTPPKSNRPAHEPVDNEVDVEDEHEGGPVEEGRTAEEMVSDTSDIGKEADPPIIYHQTAESTAVPAAYGTRSVTKRLSSRKRILDSPVNDPAVTSMICQLHMAGISMSEISWTIYTSGKSYREMVYKCSNFNDRNHNAPFLKRDDGKKVVDWNMMNAVCQVMALNVRSAWHQWAEPEEMYSILPYGFGKAVFWKQPGPGKDWAAVTGNWSYIYAFIDYNDFFAYNFAGVMPHPNPDRQRNDLEGISEAVGGVNTLRLRLVEDGQKSEDDVEMDEDNPYPPLHFTGESAGPNGSTFKGQVSLLEDGSRHWTFVIRYSGADRWQTECVEIGGRGVYGIWSDVLHEELSPSV